MPTISMMYAGLLGLISLAIAFQAGRLRGRLNISIGDGGNQNLLLAMRRQANFVEYVPLALIIIALLEMNHVRPAVIHALGATLVVARVSHAIGLRAETMKSPARFAGAFLTMVVTIVASAWAVVAAL